MKALLMRWLPARIIAYMAKKIVELGEKELRAQRKYDDWLPVKMPNTYKPVIVAIVGLTGSGKSTVARYLANLLGATVICGDDIRVELRKQGAGYDNSWLIAENLAMKYIGQNRNVIMDSDFVDKNKRESLRQAAKKEDAELIFIRTVCDFDVMFGRIITADYSNDVGNFFGGAKSAWKGPLKGAVVKLREMFRRVPQHYRWQNSGGGKWVLRKMPFITFSEINTTTDDWDIAAQSIAVSVIHEHRNKTGS